MKSDLKWCRWASFIVECVSNAGSCRFRGVVNLDERTFLCTSSPSIWLEVDGAPYRAGRRQRAAGAVWVDRGHNCLHDYYSPCGILEGDSANVGAVLHPGDEGASARIAWVRPVIKRSRAGVTPKGWGVPS